MIGEITDKKAISMYQPSEEVALYTSAVKKNYDIGSTILNKPWLELNNRSIVDDENRGQMMFNAFVDTDVEDPSEAWKWRGTRSMARNKGVVMHANLTANFLLPLFSAQNEDDEIDRDFSELMRDVVEWMASPTVSNYQSSFLQIVTGMITNPITYMGAEYCEVFQTIKERQKDGSITKKEILDEVLSGFRAPIYSSTQILIVNAYERNIQKQRRIIKRNYKDKAELEAKYGNHPNWPLVTPGIRSIYNDEDGLFYDIKDDELGAQNLVAEEISYCRREDSEVPFINGIYFGDMDSVENNPIRHRDNYGAPKYDVVPFGYNRIGEHFFAYKSMMNCLGWDNMLYDAMSEVAMNRALLETEMPIVVTGSQENIDSDVIFPNSVVTLENENTRMTPLLPTANSGLLFSAIRETEKSINEGSVNETMSGQLPDASQKAYNVAQAQSAAKKLIGGVAKSLGESIIAYGDLMKDIALNNITVAQVDELLSGGQKIKYRTMVLENKSVGGRVIDKIIKLDPELIGKEMTDEEERSESLKLLEETGYPENKKSIKRYNPEMVAKFKYLSRVDIEEMFPKNNEYWQPVLLQLKQALANDPYVNQEALTKRTLWAYFQSGADEIYKKPEPVQPSAMALPQAKGTQLGQMVQSKQLSTVAQEAVS